MRGSVVKKGHSLVRQDRARPRSAHRTAPPEVALGLPHEARGREGTGRPAVEVRPRRVRRADAADASPTTSTDWLKAIEHTVRPSTFDSYSRNVRNHVDRPHRHDASSTKVDAGVLNGLYALLLDVGSTPAVADRARATRPRSSSERSSCAPTGCRSLRPPSSCRPSSTRPSTSRRTRSPRCSAGSRRRRRSTSVAGGPRPPHRQLRPHDPPPRVQGRRPLGTPRPQPGRRRRPATRRPEVRRRPRVGRGDAAHVPRRSHARRAIGSTRCGCCSPRPACAAARRSAFGGRTSTSTPAGSASSRRSPRRAAR